MVKPCALFTAGLLAAAGLSADTPQAPVAVAGREPTLAFGGLLQVQAEGGDAGDSRFGTAGDRVYLRRARLNATAKFLEHFEVRLEGDFSGSVTPGTALRAQLTDAYIHWNPYAAANVRVGQFKTPYGFEQLYADPRLPILERTLGSDRLTLSRQLGVQVSGEFAEKRFGYAIGGFNGTGTNTTSNDDSRFTSVGRIWGVPARGKSAAGDWSWSIGADGFHSRDQSVAIADLGLDSTPATNDKDGIFAGKRNGWGVDSQFTTPRFDVWIELLRARFEPADAIPKASFDAEGRSIQAGWMFVPDQWQLVARYDRFSPDLDVSASATTTWTEGVNWLIKGNDLRLGANVMAIDPPGDAKRQVRGILRLQVIF